MVQRMPTGTIPGDLLYEGVTRLLRGSHYNYTGEGHTFIKTVPKPNPGEVTAVREGKALFGLFTQENVVILLANFGCRPWSATHYNWWINPPWLRPDPVADLKNSYAGIPLRVLLANSSSGVIEAARTFHLPGRFSRILLRKVALQAQSDFDPWRHLDVFLEVMRQYPDRRELLAEAICVHSFGVKAPVSLGMRRICSMSC